jgi:hypothetical protein
MTLMQMRDAEPKFCTIGKPGRAGDRLPWEVNRHGIMRWYLHPLLLYTALKNFRYLQCIPPASRSR